MPNTQTEPLVLAAKDVSRGFSSAISQVKYGGRRVVVTRQGRPVAAIVPMADLQRLEAAAASSTPDDAGGER